MKSVNEKGNQIKGNAAQQVRYIEKLYELLIMGYITVEELKERLNK
jgi:hypothetical protein